MTTVEKIKAKILDLAIRGKLVPQDPNDEPASVLLERIKAEKAKLVKAKKIKKDKNPSEIVVGADGATYEKFADGTTKDISDELPFDLPQGWAWARLFNVSSAINSKPHQILESNIISYGRFPVVSQGRNRIDGYCNQADKALSEVPVILFGDHTRVVKFIDYPFIVGADGTKLFKPLTNPKWLYYWTTYASTTNLQSRGYGRHWNLLNLIFIPLPTLAEQKRIVSKIEELFAYVDKISEASERIANTAKRIEKKMLDLAIRGQLVPQDPNDEPASELVRRIEAARTIKAGGKKSRVTASDRPAYEIDPPFDIPDSWEWVRLGDVFEHNTGKALNRNNAAGDLREYITTSNVYWDEFRLHGLKQMPFTAEELNKCTVRKGDMLVCEGGDIGRAAIWYSDKEVCIQNHLHRLRAYVDVCVPYFCFVLRLYKATNRLQGKGIGLQGFSSGMLHNLIVPLPPLAEQKRIVAKIEELRAMTKSLTT